MKFDNLIVGRRGASPIANTRGAGAGSGGESPGACSPQNIADGFADSSLPSPIQDGQFFIAQNGGVYARNFKDGDQEILLPEHVAAKDASKLADSRSRREALTCLKLLIQMRDLKAAITAGGIHPSLQEEMRADLLSKYKGFVQGFGPLNCKKKSAEPDPTGWKNPYHNSSRVKAFRDSPDGAYIADLEVYDVKTGKAQPAAILGDMPVAIIIETPEEDDRLRPGPSRMERRELELELGL